MAAVILEARCVAPFVVRVRFSDGQQGDLTSLLHVLDAGEKPQQEHGRTVVTLHEPGAHFRSNEWTTVAIALSSDGVVEIETKLEWQEDGFY
jgi:hypothetical protein